MAEDLSNRELKEAIRDFTEQIKVSVRELADQNTILRKNLNNRTAGSVATTVNNGGYAPAGAIPGSLNSVVMGIVAMLTGQSRTGMAKSAMGEFINALTEMLGNTKIGDSLGLSTGHQTTMMAQNLLYSMANSSNAANRAGALNVLESRKTDAQAFKNYGEALSKTMTDIFNKTKLGQSDIYKVMSAMANSGNLSVGDIASGGKNVLDTINAVKVFGGATKNYDVGSVLDSIHLLTGKMDVNSKDTKALTQRLMTYAGGDREKIPQIVGQMSDAIKGAISQGFSHSEAAVMARNAADATYNTGVPASMKGEVMRSNMQLQAIAMDSPLAHSKRALAYLMVRNGMSGEQIKEKLSKLDSTAAIREYASTFKNGAQDFQTYMRFNDDMIRRALHKQGVEGEVAEVTSGDWKKGVLDVVDLVSGKGNLAAKNFLTDAGVFAGNKVAPNAATTGNTTVNEGQLVSEFDLQKMMGEGGLLKTLMQTATDWFKQNLNNEKDSRAIGKEDNAGVWKGTPYKYPGNGSLVYPWGEPMFTPKNQVIDRM